MAREISEWLAELGLDKYLAVFVENEIDMAAAQLLDNGDLKEMGLPIGPRKKLMAAIAALAGSGTATDGPGLPNLDASRRQVTVLFADIVGFTTLSSSLDAEQTHILLNDFFAAVDGVVSRNGGAVDKHIGDAMMAVFGAPVAHTDDPERALRTARGIHRAVSQLVPPLRVHIGVAAGQVVASTTGSAAHTEYTVTGDSVNLAARLTDLAQAGETLVSASVQQALAEQFEGDDLGPQSIAGLPAPMTVWRLRGLGNARAGASHPFVGRRREFSRFEGAVRHCLAQGVGEAIVVRGEPGIGKSRLLGEFRRLATENGFRCHTSLVLDFGTGKGQDAVRWFVRSLLEIKPGSGKAERERTGRWAMSQGLLHQDQQVFLNDLLDLKQPPDLRGLYDAMDNDTRNQGRLATVTTLVLAFSRQSPLLLTIEDLHWADPVLLNRVALLAKLVAGCRAILLLSTRLAADPFDDDWRATTSGAPVSIIDLGAMDQVEAFDLARAFPDIEHDLVATCIERAGGNPLFLEQLLRNADGLRDGEIPGTLQGIVQARLDTLPATDKAALQAASILGQRFSRAALAALLGHEDYQPELLLSQALIRSAGADFHFAHALIRDGVYSSMLKAQRAALHAIAAEYFMDLDPILHAQHSDAAGDPGAATAYLYAAERQHNAFRHDSALVLIDRALALDAPRAVRFNAMCLQAELLRELGETDRSVSVYEQAGDVANGDRQNCQVNIGLAEGLRIADRYEDCLQALDRAEAAAQPIGDSQALARIHCLRGGIFFSLGNFDGCLAEHGLALELAIDAGSSEAEVRALSGFGDAWYMHGRMQTAYDYFDRCIETCQRHDFPSVEAPNLNMRAIINVSLGNLSEAKADITAVTELAVRIGDQRTLVIAKGIEAQILNDAGQGERAEILARESLVLSLQIGSHMFSVDANFIL
ncbi:MAG: AAA family ATPase, partial [Rhodospirillaceae bacterium]|nr:AAA family ATPase [Rhodospirillaceae bacterium]